MAARECGPVCLTEQMAREIACRPFVPGRMIGGGRTARAVCKLSATADGESAPVRLRFAGPVLVVGLRVFSPAMDFTTGDFADVPGLFGLKLQTDDDRTTLTAHQDDNAPPAFVPALALALPDRALNLILEGAAPSLTFTARPLIVLPFDGPSTWPPLELQIAVIYHAIAGAQ